MGKREIKKRVWNWIPHTKEVIDNYLTKLSPDLYTIKFLYKPEQISILVQTDHQDFIKKIENHFISGRFDFESLIDDECNTSIRLIYLADTQAIKFEKVNNAERIFSLDYGKTDVAIDLISFTTLMHGPHKFGFVKSLILGLISAFQNKNDIYGLHSALVSQDSEGVLFAGSHNAGKSSMSIIYALTEPSTILHSDDWVLCEKYNGNLYARPLELNAYLDPKVVNRIIEAVPSNKILNTELATRLENFVKCCSCTETNKLLGQDNRMCLCSPLPHVSRSFLKIRKMVALVGEKDDERSKSECSEFINTFTDFSFHIPFHSSMSRQTLEELFVEESLDDSTKSLVRDVIQNQKKEQNFWIQNEKFESTLIFDTSNDDLWEQYCLLREQI